MLMEWIARRIPDGENIRDERVRSAYGKAASLVGIGCNALLFAGKLMAGIISGSMSITADAVNNLSDASSSVISLLGFKLADKPADAQHPYGHGRYEYFSGLMVAVMILVIGVELLKGSVEKIISPTEVAFSWVSIGVLAASIAVKLWMAMFNRSMGKKIESTTLMATADDSRNDVISTSAVLIAALVERATGLALDGYMGAAVAVFILVSGVGLVRETIDPMLGTVPSEEQVKGIRKKLLGYPGVLGVHDLMVHDYGPGRQFASVHVEMSSQEDPLVSHDLIDNIERDFLKQDGLHLVIHYDPVVTDDPRVPVMRDVITRIVKDINPEMTIHDLRIVPGNTHINVVFDCVVPFGLTMNEDEIRDRISREVSAQYPNYYTVATLEHGYVGGSAGH